MIAVLAGLRATAAPPAETVSVAVAARDLGGGVPLTAADLTTVELTPDAVPAGHIRDPVGRVLAAPMRRGEPMTDARLLGPSLTRGHPGLVAAPVRFPDTAMAGLLHVGDVVDLIAADPQGGPPETLATDAMVLVIPPPPEGAAADGLPGRLVVLGLGEADVAMIASASVTRFLTFAYAR